MGWAIEEFETIDLGDNQLNNRVVLIAERLVHSPSASILKACQYWKTQAAYRLISNDAVNAGASPSLTLSAPCNAWLHSLWRCAF